MQAAVPGSGIWLERYNARAAVSEGVRSMAYRDWPVEQCGDKMAMRPMSVNMIFFHFYGPHMINEGWNNTGPVCLPASEAFIQHLRVSHDDGRQACSKRPHHTRIACLCTEF